MADQTVHITSTETGAFKEAFEGLPPWATEDTAAKIEKILKDSRGIQAKFLEQLKKCCADGKKQDPKNVEALDAAFKKMLKDVTDDNKERKKRNKEEKDEHEEKKDRWSKEAQIATLRNALWAGLAAVAFQTKQAMIDNVNTFDQLYKSGVNVVSGFNSASDGFESLRQLTILTGVRFTELASAIAKYGTAVNNFGLENFAKTLGNSKKALADYNYTTKEAADLLGSYLENQRAFSNINSKTQAEVQQGMITFGKRMTSLSMAMGIARTQLLTNVEAISKSVDASLLSIQIGEQAADATLNFIGSLKDQKLGNALLRLMTDVIKPLNTTFMDLQKTGFGGFAIKLQRFTESLAAVEDPEEKARLTAQFAKENERQLREMQTRGRLLEQAGLREGAAVSELASSMMKAGRDFKEIDKADKEKLRISAAASAALKNSWETFLAQFQKTFAPLPKILDMFTWVLVKVDEGATAVRNWIGKVEDWLNSFEAITNITGKIDLLPWIGIGIIGAGALASVKLASSAFQMAFGLLRGTVVSTTKAIGFAAKPFLSIGKALGPVARGVMSASKFLLSSLGSVGGVIAKIAPMVMRFLGPIGLLYTAFQVGSAIGETIYETLSQFEWFNDMMGNIFSYFENLGPNIVKRITAVGEFIHSAGKFLYDIFESVGKHISDRFKAIAGVWQAGMDLLSGAISSAGNFIASSAKSVANFISTSFSNIVKTLGPAFQKVASFIIDGVKNVKTLIADSAIGMFRWFGDKVKEWFPWIEQLTTFISDTVGSIGNFFKEMKSFGDTFIESLMNFLGTVMKKFVDKMIPDALEFWKKKPEEMKKEEEKVKKSVTTPENEKPKAEPKEERPKESIKEPVAPKIATVSLPDLKPTTSISRLSTPKASDLNSPSEVSTKKNEGPDGPITAKKTEIAAASGLRESNAGSDINMAIGYQTSVLEQILSSTNALVSVNQDILRYSKVNT